MSFALLSDEVRQSNCKCPFGRCCTQLSRHCDLGRSPQIETTCLSAGCLPFSCFCFSQNYEIHYHHSRYHGWIKVVWGPWLKLRRGRFFIYKTVVNRAKTLNERIEVFVLLKQKKLEQKNESLTNMDITIWTKLIDSKFSFLAGDLKPYR